MADHIQIPQTWMRNFAHKEKDKGDCVYSFFVESGEIRAEKIKSLGAESNHYIEDFEKHLGEKWETPLGIFCKSLRKSYKNNLEMSLSNEDTLFLKKFLAISVSRSKTYKAIDYFESDKRFPYIGYREIPTLAVEASNGILFENYACRLVFNTSNIGFVLPSYSICYTYHKDTVYPLMIIDNKIAILFDESGNTNNYFIDDELLIRNVNKWAYITEYYTNHDFIIASKENDLEILLNDIKRSNWG